jgi:hypothetical protein
MDQGIKRTEDHTRGVTALHPDIEKAGEEFRELVIVEMKAAFDLAGRSARKGRVDLEIIEPEFLGEIAIKTLGTGVETGLMEYGDDTYFDPGCARFVETSGPEFGVSEGPTLEEFAMDVGVVHRSAERGAEHGAQDIIPGRRIADEICLQIMGKMPSPGRRGAVHELACFDEPCRAHDHRLSALPVDFAFLDPFVFKMVKQAAGQERDKDGGEAVRFLVLEAVVAGDVAFGGRQKNDAENLATHGLSFPIR